MGKVDWKDKEAVRQYRRQYMRQYRQRPEVKERRRQYMRQYCQRPEVKERRRQYYQRYHSPKISLIDVFDFDEPLSIQEIRQRGSSIRNLKKFMKIGLIVQTEDGKYKINTQNPFHVIANGYFIKKLEEEKRR